MTDVMVSVRMPTSLLEELKSRSKREHYLDPSEMLRSIIRKEWMAATNPELAELKHLRHGIEQTLKENVQSKIQEQVKKELEKIHQQLKAGERK